MLHQFLGFIVSRRSSSTEHNSARTTSELESEMALRAHIVLPLDGSRFAEALIPSVIPLALMSHSTITLLTVLDPLAVIFEPFGIVMPLSEYQQEAWERDAQCRIKSDSGSRHPDAAGLKALPVQAREGMRGPSTLPSDPAASREGWLWWGFTQHLVTFFAFVVSRLINQDEREEP
jgi:hypothetical protein